MNQVKRAIVLAAGKGSRMQALVDQSHKSLLPINSEPIVCRIIRQLRLFGVDDVTVIVGYRKELLIDAITPCADVKFIENSRFEQDINILSLALALRQDLRSFHLFESDCVFEDDCVDAIVNGHAKDESCWYSVGPFLPGQGGGILKADQDHKISDIRIVGGYADDFKDYRKMIGVLHVGEDNLTTYARYLFQACDASIRQYYHMPWIEHMDELSSRLCELDKYKAMSFNTIDDYRKAAEAFADETRSS
jgi:choline kinase